VLEVMCSEKVERHFGVDVHESVTDHEQHAFQLGVTAAE